VIITLTIRYSDAPDIKENIDMIIEKLDLFHVVPQFVYCVRSHGSKSRRIVARIHGLGRIWQETLGFPSSYIIEVISERFDKMSKDDKQKTLIHELLHIPHSFAGGFRPHKGYIHYKTIEKLYRKLHGKAREYV
jgi:predicted metallopeptidase